MAESTSSRGAWRGLDRFDRLVIAVALALTLAIGFVALAGDRVGVTVPSADRTPAGTARGLEPVRIRFSHAMDAASVEARFAVEPAHEGSFAWPDANTLVFTPHQPWQARTTYTVAVEAGARASSKASKLRERVRWSFDVPLPRVVYLTPADAYLRALGMIDLETGAARTLLAPEGGIEDFALSPGGDRAAFTQHNDDGTSDIWVAELATAEARPVTRCVRALCSAPAWHPGGTALAYQRLDFNPDGNEGVGQSRAWQVDLTTLATSLLYDDPQILGMAPVWSPDGRRVAAYDAAATGIRVRDLETGEDLIIDSMPGVPGAFSPDATRLVYPLLVRGSLGEQFYTHLEVADFAAGTRFLLTGVVDVPIDDGFAAWSPHGETLVVARRYLDDRYTPGKQLYLLDAATGDAEPLVVDDAYTHAAMQWDPTGRYMAFQRFPIGDLNAVPSLWLYDSATGATTPLVENAFLPAWLP